MRETETGTETTEIMTIASYVMREEKAIRTIAGGATASLVPRETTGVVVNAVALPVPIVTGHVTAGNAMLVPIPVETTARVTALLPL